MGRCLLSVAQRAEHGNSSLGPVTRGLSRGHANAHEKVGGVAGGGKHSPPLGCSVHGAVVGFGGRDVDDGHGSEPHSGGCDVDDFGLGFAEYFGTDIPRAAFQVQAFDVNPFICCLLGIAVHHREIECYSIDGQLLPACVILECCCHERLCEEKAAHPAHRRSSMVEPVLQHGYTLIQVFDVARQRLHGRI